MENLADYLAALASDAPTPGGGSAATVVAAAGAALVAMVARIDAANPKYAQQRALAERLIREADAIRARLLDARARDESAFAQVVAAQALPKDTLAEQTTRRSALESALTRAADEPLSSAELCLHVLRLATRALAIPNRNLASDLGCAAAFAYAGVIACAYNVRINHRYMHDRAAIEAGALALASIEHEAAVLENEIRDAVAALMSKGS